MKVLLAEDSTQLNKALSTVLKRNSYLVDSAFDGEEALLFLRDYQYDVIILDIMMPKVDGLTVLKKARERGVEAPILLLTAKSTLEDKIVGLDAGADDYLPKPFAVDELLARLRALSRRKGVISIKNTAKYGDIILNCDNCILYCNDKSVVLINKEMQIMSLLINANGKIVSLDSITKNARNIDAYSTNENVWVFISYLRRKLESLDSKVKIKSVRFQGYYLEYKND